ncbi:hypothetical protein D0U04_22100 [Bacillus clarus]|uniref:Lipoprotein n=1 Tax=Bacillus clarus TaxID=2338372 RepID=A0A090YLY8_9BACI|nr:hypothetical protein [Bacillus clarus]KFM99469.1 hypothetical protein DJ93_1372 [Bacillus clarus]RFT64454.1 hypothetical protein D0U04_22100 [Bacillus clarus]
MKSFIKKIGTMMFVGLLLIGCQSQEKSVDQKKAAKKKEAQIHVTQEDEGDIRNVIQAFVQTTNEKKLNEHMALFSGKMLGAEDLKTQKEAAFKKGDKTIELNNIQVKSFKENYVIVETDEKEINGGASLQKKVQYALDKEDGQWKIEEVRVVDKK